LGPADFEAEIADWHVADVKEGKTELLGLKYCRRPVADIEEGETGNSGFPILLPFRQPSSKRGVAWSLV
jgi:hypothetical protein